MAELLQVPKTWVYEQSRMSSIPTVKLGRYYRYRLESIMSWIAALEGQRMRSPCPIRMTTGLPPCVYRGVSR